MAFADGDKRSAGVPIPVFASRCSCSFGKLAQRGVSGDIQEMVTMVLGMDTTDRGHQYPPASAVAGWMFFAWATEPFFTLITTFVFSPYFATHVAADPDSGQSLWGFATAAAGLAGTRKPG